MISIYFFTLYRYNKNEKKHAHLVHSFLDGCFDRPRHIFYLEICFFAYKPIILSKFNSLKTPFLIDNQQGHTSLSNDEVQISMDYALYNR